MLRILSCIFIVLAFCSSTVLASTGVSGDSQINRCEQKSYTISLTNNTGNDVTEIVIENDLSLLPGFTYVSSSSNISTTSNTQNCSASGVDPSILGSINTYTIDSACGGPFTLDDGGTIEIEYDLITDCEAVSGSNEVTVDYLFGGNPSQESSELSIEVLPGAVTIKKTLAVQSAAVGDPVSWTLTIENTGLGSIKNVQVTDVLGDGLLYTGSSLEGVNSGQTTTWGPAEVAAFAEMLPGDVVTLTLEALVIGCDGLDNTADVEFGCDLSTPCFDTEVDGGTATASVQRIVKTPLLSFTPPDITFDYCGGSSPDPVSVVINNDGDGDAFEVKTHVDFDPLAVTVTSPDASYNAGTNTFSLDADNPIPAGDSYTLEFTLENSDWCSSTLPDSPLLWQKIYEDECANDFYPPVELSSIAVTGNSPTLAVSKSGPSEIQISDEIDYSISVTYGGTTSCGVGGVTGDVTVVDIVPSGFTVVSATSNSNYVGGVGTWIPSPGGTGGTINWTFDPSIVPNFSAAVTLQSPGLDECDSVCYTTFTNTVTASVTDCCGCLISDTASHTTAIECGLAEVASEKTVSPAVTERCDILSYTNTYEFGTVSDIELNELILTEHAEQGQTYVTSSLMVSLDTVPLGCGSASQSGAGSPVEISLTGCPADAMSNHTLEITYSLDTHYDTGGGGCSDATFYSWSSLYLGDGNGGGICLADGIIHETTQVGIEAPAMALTIGGLGATINTCEEETVTIDLSQVSAIANPRDVTLKLSGLNYYVIDPTMSSCTGSVVPVSCTPSIDGGGDYVWTFNDAFSTQGADAKIELAVQKRCSGSSDLEATAYFDDKCGDDATPDEICSVTASDSPALLTSGDLIITKTPEIYHAENNLVTWVIYLTNRGAGTAYNVWVDDVLGSGLELVTGTSVVDPDTGDVVTTENLDHSGSAINGVSFEIEFMAPGEKREIRVTAKLIDCENLTNDVTASWGCIGVSCQTEVTDNSEVVIPTPNLVYTTVFGNGSLAPCSEYVATISGKNSGQTTVYDVQLDQSLPTGMSYVTGSTRWRLNGGGWNGPNVVYDPNPDISPLSWTSGEIPALASLAPGDVIEIEYSVSTSCSWQGGNAVLHGAYQNPCGDVFDSGDKTFSLSVDDVDISVEKTRVTPGAIDPLTCGQGVVWEIDVTNNSGHTVEVIRVSDTIGDAFENIASTDGNAAQISPTEIQWEIGNLAASATTTLTVTADTKAPSNCGDDLDNSVELQWGCGLANDNPEDDTGIECINTDTLTGSHTSSRKPDTSLSGLSFSPGTIDSCDDSTTMTFVYENTGPTDAADLDLEINLPTGISFNSGTAVFGLGTDQSAAEAALSGIGDPTITGSGSTLTFYDTGDKANNLTDLLQADGGDDTLVLQFDVASSCYEEGDVTGTLYFYDCCSSEQHSNDFEEALSSNEPDLTITKTPVSDQVDCGENQSWEITVTNNGSGNAQVVRIEDTPGSWLTVVPASSDGVIDMDGGVWGWEFNNLGAGQSQSRTLVTTLNPGSEGCGDSYRQNEASAVWGCGTTGDAVDGNPRTTNYDCEGSSSVDATTTPLVMPDLEVTDISPTISCGPDDGTLAGSLEVTVENNGDGDTLSGFTVQVTIDGSTTYSGTYTGTLAADSSDTLTISTPGWSPDCNDCNDYSFAAVIDSGDEVCECDEDNNTYSDTYSAPIPKLEVTAISPIPSCNGESFVDVTVANTGCVDVAAGVEIDITGDLTASAVTTGSLAAGTGEETVRISLGTPRCDDDYDITATVDPNGAICECSGDDHELSDVLSVPCCVIGLQKATNGVDADDPVGPYIPEGETVTWSYVISNSGSTDIRVTDLTDDQNGSLTICEGGNTIPFILAAGDSVTCLDSDISSVAEMGDQYANEGTVNGIPLDGGGDPIGGNLTDDDPSHFHVEAPGIEIEKFTNGEEADTATGPLIVVGDAVSWEYRVTNSGNSPLTDIVVIDDQGVTVSCPETALDVGGSMVCIGSGTAQSGQYENTGSVVGTPPEGDDVTDENPSHYFGVDPSIDIEKHTNSEDADNLPGPYIPTGDAVLWEYFVTNIGNVQLTDVVVTDDQGVSVSCPETTLDVGGTMTCTGSGLSDTLQYANIGSVVGTPPVGDPVTDSDPSHYYSAQPAIDLEKATNGEDADSPTGPRLAEGANVEWTYLVTNTGDVTINDLVVTDDQGVSVKCPSRSLDPAQSMTCSGSGKAEVGQYRNIATVTGQPVAGPEVTDTDPSHYMGYMIGGGPGVDGGGGSEGSGQIELSKSVEPKNVTEGGTLTYSVTIYNAGDAISTKITVVDTLPDGFEYIPSSSRLDGSSISDPSGRQTLTWVLDPIDAGVQQVLSYQVQVPLKLTPGNYLNTVYSEEDGEIQQAVQPGGNDTDTFVQISAASDYEECCLSVDKELVQFDSPVDVIPVKRDLYYYTHSAMYLAYELTGLSNLEVDEGVYSYKLSSQRKRVLDQVSRYANLNVAHLSMRSGLGLGMEHSNDFSGESAEERLNELVNKLEELAEQSGYQGDISEIKPLLLEYYGGVPVRKEESDVVWDDSVVDESLSPMTFGMVVLAMGVELERLQDSEKPGDKFIAALLNWQLEQKILVFEQYLRGQDEDERYFPHLLGLEEGTPLALVTKNTEYRLGNQAAMLLGLSRLHKIWGATHTEGNESLEWLVETLWQAMEDRFDEENRVWYTRISVDEEEQENNLQWVDVNDLFLATIAADAVREIDDSWLGASKYKKRIKQVVQFLQQRTNEDDGVSEKVSRDQEGPAAEPSSFFASMNLVRMELLAGKEKQALSRFIELDELFWDEKYQLYQPSAAFFATADYDPLLVAGFAGLVGQLEESDVDVEQTTIDRGLAFIERILFQSGLQIQAAEYENMEKAVIINQDGRKILPLVQLADEDGAAMNQSGSLPAVAVRGVSLQLRQDKLDQMNQELDNKGGKWGQTAGFPYPGKAFSQYKSREINTERNALGMLYLEDAANSLFKHGNDDYNAYLRGTTGLEELAGEGERLWQSNLFSLIYHFERGVPLAYSGDFLEQSKNTEEDPQVLFARKYEQLKEQHLDGGDIEPLSPLYFELNQGEPFDSKELTGWAAKQPESLASLSSLVQLGRAKLHFLKKLPDESGFLKQLIQMQLKAKVGLVTELLSKSEESALPLIPEQLELIKDSRGEPLELVFLGEDVSVTGQLNLLLFLAEVNEYDGDELSDSIFVSSFEPVMSLLEEKATSGDWGSLLEQGLTIDLLSQLLLIQTIDETHKGMLEQALETRVDRIFRITGDKPTISALEKVGTVESGRNQLASYASIIQALSRLSETGLNYGSDGAKYISLLLVDFDDEFWSEKLGAYHGKIKRYNSREMLIDTYQLSELDVTLTLSSLARALNLSVDGLGEGIEQHLYQFGRQMLVSPELTTSTLNRMVESTKEFDLEILQDIDIQSIQYERPYAGDVLRYTINVYNRCQPRQSSMPLEGVIVKDLLPDDVTYLSGTTQIDGGWSDDPELIGKNPQWKLDRVDDHVTISFSATVLPEYGDRNLRNRVEARVDVGGSRRNRYCDFSHEIVDPLGSLSSSLNVLYFNDYNLDSIYDSEENDLSGIATVLSTESGEHQSADGKFDALKPGVYSVSPDWENVEQQFTPSLKTPVQQIIRESETKKLAVGLVSQTEVEGWAFEDLDGDGEKGEQEAGLVGVKIQIFGQPDYFSYSARDGYFKIQGVASDNEKIVELADDQPYYDIKGGIIPAVQLTPSE